MSHAATSSTPSAASIAGTCTRAIQPPPTMPARSGVIPASPSSSLPNLPGLAHGVAAHRRRRPAGRCDRPSARSCRRPATAGSAGRRSAAACAFSSGGRVRSVVAISRPRFCISARRSITASSPGLEPTTMTRPPRAIDAMLPAMCGPPTSSSTTSAPPSSRARANASSAPNTSAPSSATRGRSASLRTLATTRAPSARPICTAAVPTPPLAPLTSSVSPDCRPACSTAASNAVRNASGAAAACGVVERVRHPGQLALVRDHPGGVAAAADEPEGAVADRERGDALPQSRPPCRPPRARGRRSAIPAAPGACPRAGARRPG